MTEPLADEAEREQAMGVRLQEARVAAGLSIRRAARVAGLPATEWADLERGQRNTPAGPVRASDLVSGAPLTPSASTPPSCSADSIEQLPRRRPLNRPSAS